MTNGTDQYFINGKWMDTIDIRNNFETRTVYWCSEKQMHYTTKSIRLRRYEGITEGDKITLETKYKPNIVKDVIRSEHFIMYYEDGTKAYNTEIFTKGGNSHLLLNNEQILSVEKAEKNRRKPKDLL